MGNITRNVIVVFLALAVTCLPVPSYAQSNTSNDDSTLAQKSISAEYNSQKIADLYIEIAFGSEVDFITESGVTTRIRKRAHGGIVRIFPAPLPSVPFEEVVNSIERVANDLNQNLVDPNIGFSTPKRTFEFFNRPQQEYWSEYQDSIVVYVGSQEELVEVIKHEGYDVEKGYQLFAGNVSSGSPLCMAVFVAHADRPQAIGVAKVWVEYGPRMEECLYEEIMQTFGITNDFPAGTPSMFNDDNMFDRPTPLDWKLWRIHTDRRIIAGMEKDEARKIALEILEEIEE